MPTREELRDNLRTQMNAINVNPEMLRVLGELAYTASETGVLPFELRDDEYLPVVVKLVRLAEAYSHVGGLPPQLRM